MPFVWLDPSPSGSAKSRYSRVLDNRKNWGWARRRITFFLIRLEEVAPCGKSFVREVSLLNLSQRLGDWTDLHTLCRSDVKRQ
jgi:hypothetical protein